MQGTLIQRNKRARAYVMLNFIYYQRRHIPRTRGPWRLHTNSPSSHAFCSSSPSTTTMLYNIRGCVINITRLKSRDRSQERPGEWRNSSTYYHVEIRLFRETQSGSWLLRVVFTSVEPPRFFSPYHNYVLSMRARKCNRANEGINSCWIET